MFRAKMLANRQRHVLVLLDALMQVPARKTIQPVFVSHKIERDLKLREVKPPVVNQRFLVYLFKCDLCDAGYVGFTCRHLHQRVEEHKNVSSSIGKHFRSEHSLAPRILTRILKF